MVGLLLSVLEGGEAVEVGVAAEGAVEVEAPRTVDDPACLLSSSQRLGWEYDSPVSVAQESHLPPWSVSSKP